MNKIAILGYGKMGKEIESLLLKRDFEITAIIDNENDWQNQRENFLKSEAAIEFSTPQTAVENARYCITNHIPVVIGTTGWMQYLESLINFAREKETSMIYGSNFSIGANLFFSLNSELAKLMNKQEQYNVSIRETHHIAKKDAPSGTAITIADLLISYLQRKNSWKLDALEEDQIKIASLREEDVKGLHEVIYDSPEDTIRLVHEAKSREGFAQGAVKAAEWLIHHPGIYNFNEIYQHL